MCCLLCSPFVMMDHTPHLWQGVGAAPVIPPPSQEAAKKSSGAALGVSASMGDTHADISPVGSNVPSAIASGAAVESADRLASDRAVGKTGPAGTGKVIWLYGKVLCFHVSSDSRCGRPKSYTRPSSFSMTGRTRIETASVQEGVHFSDEPGVTLGLEAFYWFCA